MMTISLRERYYGAMLGLAVGDALGTTLEFQAPGTFAPVADIVGGGPFQLQAGEWTDDTSMALCLATSLLECNGFDAKDQMQRYVRWMREGYLSSTGSCFDIGLTVREALERFEQTGEPFSGSTDVYSAGNGSLMRLAPVPLFYRQDIQQALFWSSESSRTTHGTPVALDACRYFAALLLGVLNDCDKATLLDACYEPVSNCWQANPLAPEIAEIAAGSFRERQPPQIRGTGYVVRSLEAALWAFYHSTTFQEGCLLAVNLGDDADTTGAIYGQLAGAYYGEQAIPQAWRERIVHRALIMDLARNLYLGSMV